MFGPAFSASHRDATSCVRVSLSAAWTGSCCAGSEQTRDTAQEARGRLPNARPDPPSADCAPGIEPRAASGRPRGAPTRHLRTLARVADETNCTTGAAHVRESRTGCAGRPVTSSTSPTVRQHASCPGTSAPSIAVLEPPGAAVRLSDNATGFPLRRRQRQLSCDEAWCRDVVVSPAATPNCRCDYVLPLLVVNKGGCAARATGAQRSDQ